jgi:hypothetical protein
MTDEREVLSALIDREPVDPDVLARVLEDTENRKLLVDFVRLRMATTADEPPLTKWRPPAINVERRSYVQSRWARVAALLLLVISAAGAGAGIDRFVRERRPPTPSRTVRFDPAPFKAASDMASVR